MSRLETCILGIYLLSIFLPPVAQGTPLFNPPDWIEISEVSSDMTLAGRPTNTLHLVSSRPASAVLEHFRSLWNCGEEEKHCRQADMPPWSVLSRLRGKKLEYVQIRNLESGATGYLSLSELKREQIHGMTLPMMQGSRIINNLTTRDRNRKSRVMLVRNTYSVMSNGTFYREYFVGQGWQQVTDDTQMDSQVQVFQQGSNEAHLVISRQRGATQVVINLVQ